MVSGTQIQIVQPPGFKKDQFIICRHWRRKSRKPLLLNFALAQNQFKASSLQPKISGSHNRQISGTAALGTGIIADIKMFRQVAS
jgi:hypothetical protein